MHVNVFCQKNCKNIPKTRKIIHYPNWQFCFRSQWMRIPTQANKLKSWEARPTFSPSLRLVKQLLSLHWRISCGLSGKWTAPWRLGSVWIPKNCQLYNCISQLPESSGNRVKGLCGNFNGVESDDRTGRAGEVTIFKRLFLIRLWGAHMSWSGHGRSQVSRLVTKIPALLVTRPRPGDCVTPSSETRR